MSQYTYVVRDALSILCISPYRDVMMLVASKHREEIRRGLVVVLRSTDGPFSSNPYRYEYDELFPAIGGYV